MMGSWSRFNSFFFIFMMSDGHFPTKRRMVYPSKGADVVLTSVCIFYLTRNDLNQKMGQTNRV